MRKVTMTLGLAVMLAGCQNEKPVDTTAAAAKPAQVAQPSSQPAGQGAGQAGQEPSAGQAAMQQAALAAQQQGGGGVHGKVLETMNAAGYTYLKLQTANGEAWAAVTETTVPVGSEVELPDAMLMQNFESKTLNRKFDKIYFGSLAKGGANGAANGAAPADQAASQPAGGQQMQGGLPSGHPPMNQPAQNVGDVKVDKAKAPNAKTVAEVWGEKAKLKDQKVTIHGKVVKASNGILGKNWLHLRDGSGTDAAKDNDILVTTSAVAAVGDVVTVEGLVRLDKDFGAGYSYAVLVEDATVQK